MAERIEEVTILPCLGSFLNMAGEIETFMRENDHLLKVKE
jgi:hypothetical protein